MSRSSPKWTPLKEAKASNRRSCLLESLRLEGPHWFMPAHFDDGEALFAAVQEQGLEGVVAKRLEGRYRPAERDWIKMKNRDYWRYPQELEAAKEAAAAGDDLAPDPRGGSVITQLAGRTHRLHLGPDA